MFVVFKMISIFRARGERNRGLLLPLTLFLLKILRLSQVWWLAPVIRGPRQEMGSLRSALGNTRLCRKTTQDEKSTFATCVFSFLFAVLYEHCRRVASPKAQGNLALQRVQFSQVMTVTDRKLSNLNSHYYIFNNIKSQPNLNERDDSTKLQEKQYYTELYTKCNLSFIQQ